MNPGWLSLTVSEEEKSHRLFISIPKKIVRLATRRNRIKRLIRESVQRDAFFKKEGRCYRFRVHTLPPESLKLRDVLEMMESFKQ